MAKKIPTEPPSPLAHNPFGPLADRREGLPAGPAAPAAAPPKAAPAGPARAVVRLERKGRGGKEVTVVEQLGLRPRDLEAWTKALKGALGCGGVVEGQDIVLQGDHRERVAALLAGRGVKKVIQGT